MNNKPQKRKFRCVSHEKKVYLKCINGRGNFMIITIARQCGSGGVSVGKMIADYYDIPIYDKASLNELAQEKGIYDKYSNFLAERTVNSLLYAITMGDNVAKITDTPKEVLAQLIGDQDCVLVGRCGNFVYRDRSDCVSVYLHGDLHQRVAVMEKQLGVSEKVAKKLVQDTDEERAAYHKYYTKENWGAAEHYDICLDSCRLHFDQTAKVITQFIDSAC